MRGVSPFNAKLAIEQATGVVPEAQKTMTDLRKTLDSFERLTPEMQTTLKEIGDLAKAGREFIPELKRTNDGLRDIFANNDLIPALQNLAPELRKTLDDVRYFLKTTTFWVNELGVSYKTNEPKLVKAVDTLTTTTERIGNVFTPENQKAINNILKNTDQASARFDRVAMQAEDLMKDGRVAVRTLNSTLGQAEQAITEIRQVTRPLAEKTPRILDNADATMSDLREIVKAVGRSDGTLMKIITDPSLFNNLNETLCTVQKLMPRLDRILKDVEVFADKIARHPELLGVRGAVSPSTGLKEAPSGTVNKVPNGP
jgi:phospholipid/cholesterol/gamma-HCH transport system substrate-binding protein